jgi:uncharacterized protein
VLSVTADSNIYISAFQFCGKPLQLLTLAAEERIDLAISDHIVEEVTRTLRRKFDWSAERIAEATLNMATIARRVVPSQTLDIVKDDPSDNRILECAVEAGSECIVTGDADLLRLGQYSGIRIVNVAALLDIVGQ